MVVLVVVVVGDVFVSAVSGGGGGGGRGRMADTVVGRGAVSGVVSVGLCGGDVWGPLVGACVCCSLCASHHHECLTVFGILLCVSFWLVGWCVDCRPTVMPDDDGVGAGWGVRHDTRRSCSV